MQLRKSARKRAKMKMALQGPSGSGKSYSSLLIANGLAGGDMTKIAVIDSENGSANLYSHLGDFNVLQLKSPFSPERYIQAIEICEKADIEVIILDSISHCWDFLLDFHGSLTGNSFTNWNKVTPRQRVFIDKILQSETHIIATMRTKQDYVLNNKHGKFVPQKVGLKAVQRDGVDYEFTLVFDIDIKHNAIASKDRTGLFIDKPEIQINASTGKKILRWCQVSIKKEELEIMVDKCNSLKELSALYHQHSGLANTIQSKFVQKREQLQSLINPQNFSNNGITNSE
jgi:AAA domain